ncbi:type I site-specific deoxyribonuclease, HsdR family, putative [Aciduliprofundum boonei T469]|nr:type I site-specific deoxyribonuclease, HsdR family, putative [Aciduliprofundum boonei T469]
MPLQSEVHVTHENIKKMLEEIGWINGNDKYRIAENSMIRDYYLPKILEDKIKDINQDLFSNLTPSEERQVLDYIHNELKNAGEERILEYLKYGVKVVVRKETLTIWLFDYTGKNNTFFYLHEAKYRGSPMNTKPDFTLFINGIPVIIIEAKSESIPASHVDAIDQIRAYEMRSPELFRFVQFAVAYGENKLYTPTMPNWEKRVISPPAFGWILKEDSGNRVNRIFDLLNTEKFPHFIKYFIFYVNPREGEKEKLIARQNQYSATLKAINRIKEYMNNGERNHGLVWHWQGSGKTYTMFFIANYFLDLYYSTHPIVFFVVDREDLENQHERVLNGISDPKFRTLFKKVESISQLGEIIRTVKKSEMSKNIIHRGVYLTTIQKFQQGKQDSEGLSDEADKKSTEKIYSVLKNMGTEYLEYLKEENLEEYQKHVQQLSLVDDKKKEAYLLELGGIQRKNVLFLIDEAHRSHYGVLGAMRKACFPNSITFGFTGTPIFKNEKNTFLEFSYPDVGEYYMDVYFIEDSIKDGFTLPIVYQVVKEGDIKEEGVKIRLTEDEIAGFIKEYMERKGRIDELLNAKISKKDVSRHITKVKVILLNQRRIEKLSEYIANRIEKDTEGFKFKAMVVAVNRLGCVRYKRALDKYLVEKFGEKAKNWTEIVMTYNYNDTDPEILEYRDELSKRRKNSDMQKINEEIQNDFLEKENPKILIVTDMLLTGFNAPILKVMYLDKPLYEHRLLQAIARVNRPFEEKEFGLIVDSFGLMEHLAKTMAIYNLLAEEEIKKDFEMNLMRSIDEKFYEFEIKFDALKNELRNLNIGKEAISIDIDNVKMSLKTGEGLDEIKSKIATLAMFYTEGDKQFSAKIIRIVNEMRALLKLYKALGAYPRKLVYTEDIEALAYLYYKLKRILMGKRVHLEKEFWNELLSYIHNKTIVREFEEVGEAHLKPEEIQKLVKDLTDEDKIRKRVINAVADFFFNLRSILNEKKYDPVYRQIMERLEKLRMEWVTRVINTNTFLARLKDTQRELDEYNEKIYGKEDVDRILETISYLTYQKTGKEVKFDNSRSTIKSIISSEIKMLTPKHKRKIKTALLKDLFISGVEEKVAMQLVDTELLDFIEEEVNRLWKE